MIGLKYVLEISEMTATALAKTKCYSIQNVSKWCSGERKIPNNYHQELEEFFGVSIELINKEINSSDMQNILKQKIQYDFNKNGSAKIDGEYITNEEEIKRKIKEIDINLRKEKIKEDINDLIDHIDDIFDESTANVIDQMIRLLESKNVNRRKACELIRAMELYYCNRFESDNRPLVNQVRYLLYQDERNEIVQNFATFNKEFFNKLLNSEGAKKSALIKLVVGEDIELEDLRTYEASKEGETK